jgi:hypothetical protein
MAVVFTACLSAGIASAQSGHVELSRQNTDVGSKDIDITALSGTTLIDEHIQIGGRYANFETSSNRTINYLSVDGFLFSPSESGAYGGYVGLDSLDTNSNTYNSWFVGGFRMLNAGDKVWTGQLGYSDTESDAQVIYLDGEVRHFINENFSIQGNLGYGDISTNSGSRSENFLSGGIGSEIQFVGTPISIHVAWQRTEFDNNESNQIGIGARWNFDSGTLMKRNRTGAGLSRVTPTINELDFGGWFMPR